jgi:hypothetical protein
MVTLGVLGALTYNWWIAALFIPGLLTSANAFFSDLEAAGLRDATAFQRLDITSGLCWALALVLRGRAGRDGLMRPEWKWCLTFALLGALGGVFVESCPEGTSSVCRSLERHLQLPLHHYLHLVAGTGEFVCVAMAMWLAARRSKGRPTPEGRVYRGLFAAAIALGPLLGLCYLTDRLGAPLEPVYFIALTTMALTEVLEPDGRHVGSTTASLAPDVVAGTDPIESLDS